ncbi:unnamed protein product [Lepeophtheirus salmonis]|uniref:(salmon louse) hypothetical protein n=1 Tax=Lepeophtheirus salmonis TaxID=72036 RepID=A0A7R8CWI5_LEPSM|nr:unnamed protein product [Lepeophtheirus salmonis]CAF2953655.1 unnamed protein product [Lepeophtheirus salmonis]
MKRKIRRKNKNATKCKFSKMNPGKQPAYIEKHSASSNRRQILILDRITNREINRVENMIEKRIENHKRSNQAEKMTMDRLESLRRYNLIESMYLDQIENNRSRRQVENMDEIQVENERVRQRVENIDPTEVENIRARRRKAPTNSQHTTNPLNEARWGNIDQFDASIIIGEKQVELI